MDLGATVCTPALPKCPECPLNKECFAFDKNLVSILPVKSKKAAVKLRYFHYLLLRAEDKIWIQKRTGKDIWQNLYQPYLIESEHSLDSRELQQEAGFIALDIDALPEYEGALKQRLTHQLIETRFFTVNLPEVKNLKAADGMWVSLSKLKSYAYPSTLVSFFEKKNYF
jgi:A/G-specific adenine glycosylase